MAVINLPSSIAPCSVVGTEAWRAPWHCNLMFMFEANLTSWESMLVIGRGAGWPSCWLTLGSLKLGTLRWHKGRQGESGEEILSLMPNQPPFVHWDHQKDLLLLTLWNVSKMQLNLLNHSLHWFSVRLLLGVQFLLHGHPTRPKASKWPLCRKTKFSTEHTSPSSSLGKN